MGLQRIRFRSIAKIDGLETQLFESPLVPLHRRPVQPKFLFVKLDEIFSVAKKKALLDQYDSGRLPLESRMIVEQLMWKYEQIQFFAPKITNVQSVRSNRVTQSKLNRLS